MEEILDRLAQTRSELLRHATNTVGWDMNIWIETRASPMGRKINTKLKLPMPNASNHIKALIFEQINRIKDGATALHLKILADMPCLDHPHSKLSIRHQWGQTKTALDGFSFIDTHSDDDAFRSRILRARDRLAGIDKPTRQTCYAIGEIHPIVADNRETALVIHDALVCSTAIRATSLTKRT